MLYLMKTIYTIRKWHIEQVLIGIILWINQFTYQQQASESQEAEEEGEEGEMVIEEEEEEEKPAKGKKVRAEEFSFIHERTQVNKLEQINCCLVINDW